MKYLNKIMLIGYVAGDPIVEGEGEKKVAKFTVAIKLEGEETFHKIIATKHLAELVENYTIDKQRVYIEGHLENYFNSTGILESRIVLEEINRLV